MKDYLFNKQSDDKKILYIELLKIIGSLSNLFSNSDCPFLHYRVLENVYCKVFNAIDLSRKDLSVDAKKDNIGIGLKTFLQKNGKTFQKVAEFDKESNIFRKLNSNELIKQVAIMRNERIISTIKKYNLDDVIYHLVTRSSNYMAIYEEHMDLINIENIKITLSNKNNIHFSDGLNEYSFNIPKSTLLKRFNTLDENKLLEFDVEILSNPYDFLLSIKDK